MNKSFLKRSAFKLALFVAVALPELAGAQIFNYNEIGDVLAGFRKTGSYAEPYEVVVDLGNVTNFLNISAGTTINITNFSAGQLKDAFADGNSNLQWSVFGAFPNIAGGWTNAYGVYPNGSIWFTLPGTSVGTKTQSPTRETSTGTYGNQMTGCGNGAASISGFLGASNVDNTLFLVREPVSYNNYILTAYIGDVANTAYGDFGAQGSGLPFTVENTTSNLFTAAQRSDFYQMCPASGGPRQIYKDPITGQTNGPSYYVGYFIFNPNATMTFTRGFAFSASTTNGSTPLSVVFSTTATNATGATNWVWNFGNGTIITNTTSGNVTNTYASGGSYTVTLTINGPNGSSVLTMPNYVVVTSSVTPTPVFTSASLSSGKLVLSGTNGPASAQFRVLMSTNLASGNWQGVYTNNFLGNGNFSYTNNSTTNPGAYFRLVTP